MGAVYLAALRLANLACVPASGRVDPKANCVGVPLAFGHLAGNSRHSEMATSSPITAA